MAILYSLFYGTGEETASTIANRFGLSRASVNNEVQHLEDAGLVSRRTAGKSKLLSLAEGHPAVDALRTLVDLTIGPLVELPTLYELEGVVRVSIFGSWARRHLGERGARPADVDVLVVGEVPSELVYDACLPIAGRLGISVNPVVVTREQVENSDGNAILASVLDGPLVEVQRP